MADDVDASARFPTEAVSELRASGLLGAMVPTRHGGEGASVEEMATAVRALAEHCASSALVLAMHTIQLAMLLRHADAATLEELAPALGRGEMLLANANSEKGLGGERRVSLCALEPVSEGYRIDKQAATVSYGEYADAVLATARRHPDSPGHDQVLTVCRPPELTLEPTGDWDTLGLRGTCSRSFRLLATVPPEMIVQRYDEVFARTGLPASAILLGAVWLGLAEAGAARAHAAVRAQARRQRVEDPTAPPPQSALRLAELVVGLHQMREVLAGGIREYERVKDLPEVTTLGFSVRIDNLMLSVTTLVNDVMAQAMYICGLAGYANRSPYSIGRLSRDAAAAPLMVHNDRALAASAQSLLIRKTL